MGEARARGTYEHRKAHPKYEAREPTKPARVFSGESVLRYLLGYRAGASALTAPSKRARREAVRFARDARMKAQTKANPIPLPERVTPPLGLGD
jgi:hypothetical protein